MYITEVSIKRPVVAWVMSMILIIFGIFVFWELPVRELPDGCLLYTSPSPRDLSTSRMPSSA